MQCAKCQQSFNIREADHEFYAHFDAPNPTMCPDCRLQHRLNFRNERTLYNRKSSLSGKGLISIYHEDSPHTIYSTEEWWSDKWDGVSYGRDFDFNRLFFEQFQELLLQVPRIALFNVNPLNSDYCQQAYDNKNCYLCMVITASEDSMYLSHINRAKDSYDCTLDQNIELCYECIDSDKLYGCVSCQSCQNSSDLWFCFDCIGSKNCFGSWGLRNKQYYIFNKPYSKEEYEEKIKSLALHKSANFLQYKKYFADLLPTRVQRATRNINALESTGNYLINAQNCHECFDCFEIQDCAYCTWIFESHHCMDVYGLGGSSWVFNCVGNEKVNNAAFNTFVSDGGDVFYSDTCFYSTDLFGCVGLRNKKYCIFNKQYSKEDYEALRHKIIEHMKGTGEWGQFFPTSLSPFAYNETAAQTLFPLGKEQVIAQGFRWREVDQRDYKPQTTQVPADINQVEAGITEEILACQCDTCNVHAGICGKNYKIPAQELKFYKTKQLPIPKKCPDCRYRDRLALRNPRKLHDRTCAKCQTTIRTTFAPNQPEVVYCEKCYTETLD